MPRQIKLASEEKVSRRMSSLRLLENPDDSLIHSKIDMITSIASTVKLAIIVQGIINGPKKNQTLDMKMVVAYLCSLILAKKKKKTNPRGVESMQMGMLIQTYSASLHKYIW